MSAPTTFERSCAHWSEDGRAGMEAFYALATLDYRRLAEAMDWRAWFEARQEDAGDRPLGLLDVACGSGKFPTALIRHGGVGAARIRPVSYALLDPSAFSIAEAAAALAPPFRPGARFETTLQDLDPAVGGFDVVWATHALYAVPADDLDAAMARFVAAIRPGGVGVVAHALADSHYIRFYDAFLDAFHGGRGERYRTGEAVADALAATGARVERQEIAYTQAADDDRVVEGYLQRCAFDDAVSLDRMLSTAPVADHLARCRRDGGWRFDQRVALLRVTP